VKRIFVFFILITISNSLLANSLFNLLESDSVTLDNVINQIDRGANVNEIDQYGRTFLMNYVWNENSDVAIFKYIYENGYNKKYVNDLKRNKTLLMESVHTGQNPEIVKFIIENGGDLEAEDDSGMTALQFSLFSVKSKYGPIRNKETEMAIIIELLSHNPDVNHQDNEGKTPLMYCYLNQNPDVLFLLLENGANPNILDDKERDTIYMLNRFGAKDYRRQMKVDIIEDFNKSDLKNGFKYLSVLPFDWKDNLESNTYFKRTVINIDELRKLNREDTRILRNYFYAIHGYPFISEDLNTFFNQFSWYIRTEDFDKLEITDIERYNIKRILYVESQD